MKKLMLLILFCAVVLYSSLPVTAMSAGTYTISFSPSYKNSWYRGRTAFTVSVKDVGNLGIQSIEYRLGSGDWEDTGNPAKIEIADNTTLTIRVTDRNDKEYTVQYNINCFDLEPPTLSAKIADGKLQIDAGDALSGVAAIEINGTAVKDFENQANLLKYFNNSSKTFVLKSVDMAGNKSTPTTLTNPFYGVSEAESVTETVKPPPPQVASKPAAVTPPPSGTIPAATEPTTSPYNEMRPLETTIPERSIPGGQGTAIEIAQKNPEEREFVAIQSADGNVFYLIIDKESNSNNVYFLSPVNELELLSLTKTAGAVIPPKRETEPEPEPPRVQTPPAEEEPAVIAAEVKPKPAKNSQTQSNLVFLLISLAGAGAFWYYMKVIKPSKESEDFDDEGDDDDDDDEDGSENEDFENEDEEFDEEEARNFEPEYQNHAQKPQKIPQPEAEDVSAANFYDPPETEEDEQPDAEEAEQPEAESEFVPDTDQDDDIYDY